MSYVDIAWPWGLVLVGVISFIFSEGIWNAMVPIWKEKGRVNSDLLSKLEILEEKTYDKIEEIFSLK